VVCGSRKVFQTLAEPKAHLVQVQDAYLLLREFKLPSLNFNQIKVFEI